MRGDLRRAGAAFALAAALGSGGAAAAADDPFLDWTLAQSQALGFETIRLRLKLADALGAPPDPALVRGLEDAAGEEGEWLRFGGSLAAAEPALASELRAALAAVAAAAAEGAPTRAPAEAAAALLDRAEGAVIPAETRTAPAFRGGVLVALLLAEGGVSEGYEEALEEPLAYGAGWAALDRVDALWRELEPLATPELRADGREMVAALRVLYPAPRPPAGTAAWNPEEAEPPSQRLAGIVEAAVRADLFPGRDLGGLAARLSALVAQGCADYGRGAAARGAERVVAARDLFDRELAGVSLLFAPEAGETAADGFAAMLGGRDDDDDDAGEATADGADEDTADDVAAEGDDHDDDDAPRAPAPTCGALAAALGEIATALGGGATR